jgi:hypothetical protein
MDLLEPRIRAPNPQEKIRLKFAFSCRSVSLLAGIQKRPNLKDSMDPESWNEFRNILEAQSIEIYKKQLMSSVRVSKPLERLLADR